MTATDPSDIVADIAARLRPRVDLPNMTFGFVIDQATYCIYVSGGVPLVSLVGFLPPSRDVTIHMSAQTLTELMSGHLDPVIAYLGRKIRVDGKISVAKQVGDLFRPA